MIKCKPSVAHCACMVQLIDGLDYECVFFHRQTDWEPTNMVCPTGWCMD